MVDSRNYQVKAIELLTCSSCVNDSINWRKLKQILEIFEIYLPKTLATVQETVSIVPLWSHILVIDFFNFFQKIVWN